MLRIILNPFKLLFQNSELIKETTVNAIRQKNAGTIGGKWWLVVSPLILLAIYSIVYLLIFRVKPQDLSTEGYVLYVFVGLLPFMSLSESISTSTMSIATNQSLLKSTVFPIELLPVKAVLSSLTLLAFGFPFIILGLAVYDLLSITILLAIPILLLLIIFAIGLGWFFSVFQILLKDTQNFITYVITLAMIGSPIAYTANMVPDKIKTILYLNPYYYFVEPLHRISVYKDWPLLEDLLLMTFISILTFVSGYHFFQKVKVRISSYV